MRYALMPFFLILGVCQNTFADPPVQKPFENLVTQETLPKPDQFLYKECIRWYTIQHKNMNPYEWSVALQRQPITGVVKGVQSPNLFFSNNIKRNAVSIAQNYDNGAIDDHWPKDGLVRWCAAMKDVLDKNPNTTGEEILCRWDLNYFCHGYLPLTEREKYPDH